jgi:hypothetical protein
MNVKGNSVLHNRFDIVVSNVETGEVIQKAQAENIILDRMYTRLCNFNTYFVNIIFGTGTGTPTASRTTLFSRLGYKAAEDVEIVRSYPNSKWVRKIRLESSEYNGSTITEVGISEHTTNINTHAMITDAEGNPLSITKNSLMVVDIYATVFIEIPNVDSGLFYISNGWRDYLTGGSAPSNVIKVATTKYDENPSESLYGYSQTATRTVDITNKRVTVSTRLEAGTFNKDIGIVMWLGTGLAIKLPRVGIFEGKQRNNVQIGVGDGTTTKFPLPNLICENVAVTVDDVTNTDWTLNDDNEVEFDTAVTTDLIVKASYKSLLIPKNSDNVFDISFTLQYDNLGSLPTPIVSVPDFSTVHGSKTVIAGTSDYGFYGEVSSEDFISGDDLANVIGLTAGTSQNSDAGWLKVVDGNKMLLIAKKTFRHTISWNNINAVDAVFGKIVTIDGVKYVLRLLSTAEWDRFMYPLHTDHPDSAPNWANYSDSDLLVSSSYGNGSYSWTSTPQSSSRVARGLSGVTFSGDATPSSATSNFGWRPVLEFFQKPAAVTFTAEQTGGETGVADSTAIAFVFDVDVVGLQASHITITPDTGAATKGSLTGSGKNWSLAITDPEEGNVKVKISGLAGYSFPSTDATVAVYAAAE